MSQIKGNKIEHMLIVIIFILCAFIFFGTLITFVTKKALPNMRKSDPNPTQLQKSLNEKTFDEIGQLRVVTADNFILVIVPYFTYPPDDSAFFEELTQKNRKMRSIILGYFAARKKQDLLNKTEAVIKEDLLQLLNAQLVLGKIKQLYFSEYIFL